MSLSLKHPYIKVIQSLSLRRKVSVYLVGGFLRDQLIDRHGCDMDFAVSQQAVGLARAFAKSIKGAFVLLDEEQPCGRVVKKENGRVLIFDFSDFRAKNLKKDLELRDFTINTLCINIQDTDTPQWNKKIISLPSALKDLKSKTIRLASNRALSDDPLRLMRAFSLYAQTGFKIESKTLAQIKRQAHLISQVSMERIREEWFKVLASPRSYDTLLLMQKADLLDRVIPQLSVMYRVHQGGYHHLDVWKHSLEVVHQFERITNGIKDNFIQSYLQGEIGGAHQRYALLKFACLLHDIGKPETKKMEIDRISFHGHEHAGAGITRLIAKQMKLSVKERYFLEDMVTWHLRPGYLSNFKKLSERMVFRFFRDTHDEALSVLLLALADQGATRGPLTTRGKSDHHHKICWQMINRFIENKNQKPLVRLITGHDLIKKLKLKPSPIFSEILNAVHEAQALGKIANRQEALLLAKRIAKI